ncbi:molecular chaperone [Acinetobacter equi]|uniref:Molecular chaperone n=1 Tax=Acinetobacter equi TaxID=1324350 RepID=A0A0N9VXI9_9GAMM|nr:molecular chaperone [Acinetobacter equi]ALH96017.1 hypothetical protein AOY20_11015 [Acinetobacter equi]
MLKKLVIFSFLSVSSILHAGILAGSTRIIFDEGLTQKSLMLVNTNDYPVFAHVWTDEGEGNPEFNETPFVVVPAAFKLKPEEIKGINIVYNQMELPKDRESVFWLNLYEIPAVSKASLNNDYLNLAMNTQMKVFYRPKALNGMDLNKIQKLLKFNLEHDGKLLKLKAENSTPYYVSIINIDISNSVSSSLAKHDTENMISPFSDKVYTLENQKFIKETKNTLKYVLIDGDGQKMSFSQEIN